MLTRIACFTDDELSAIIKYWGLVREDHEAGTEMFDIACGELYHLKSEVIARFNHFR